MNKALLLTTSASAIEGAYHTNFHRLQRSLDAGRSNWARTESAADADVILFTDPTDSLLRDVRQHSLYQAYRDKVLVNCDHDVSYPLVPGLYTSLRRGRFNPRWSEGGCYVKVLDHDWITPTPLRAQQAKPISFVGTFDNHKSRQRLARINRSELFVRDTSDDAARRNAQPFAVYEAWWHEYAQVLHNSVFILCPRGFAPSSYRIFEAMKAGRVPVIISDDWVAPVGPAWEQFSLRVKERDIERVVDICMENVGRATEMGRLAEQAFADFFSLEACAATILDRCMAIKRSIADGYRAAQVQATACGLTDLPMLRRTLAPAVKRLIVR